MKVSNLNLQPNRTFQFRKMKLDPHTAMRALVHNGSSEAVLVGPTDVKFHPEIEFVDTWEELLALPDPEVITAKSISRWALVTGDNPFLLLTAAGNPFPIEDDPEKHLEYEEARQIYTKGRQAALHSRGVAAAIRERWALAIQVILAAICVISAIITVLVLLPTVMEKLK